MRERAFTFIDRTKAVVGNRWLDRAWGLFLGDPLGLVQRDVEFSWVVDPPMDWAIALDGTPIHPTDFDPVEWTEENNPFGAAVTATRIRTGITMRVHTMAFHDAPALLRTVTLFNTNNEPARLSGATVDAMNFGDDGVAFDARVLVSQPGSDAHSHWQTAPETTVVTAGNAGLALGYEPGLDRVRTGGAVQFDIAAPIDLPPHKPVALPSTYVFAFAGPLNLRVQSGIQAFRTTVHQYRNSLERQPDHAP